MDHFPVKNGCFEAVGRRRMKLCQFVFEPAYDRKKDVIISLQVFTSFDT